MSLRMYKYIGFSPRQKMILTWWMEESQYHDYNGIIADGAIRSGKSASMSLSFILWAMVTFDDKNFAMCGKTVGALYRNVLRDLFETLERNKFKVVWRKGQGCIYITKFGHTNRFYTFSGNDERSQDAIQGVTLAGVYFDEAAIMPESFINQATGRCSVEGAKYWFNCNPAGSRVHWFKVNWINQWEPKQILYLHFTMDDNPSLSEKVKDRYKAMYAGVFYRRYIEGRWCAAEGAIYDMWSDTENHFQLEDLPSDYESRFDHIVGVDYGTSNPMVFLNIWDDGETLWQTDEYYYDSRAFMDRGQKTDFEYANDFEEFVKYDKNTTVIIDPSAASFRLELMNRGYRVRQANNDVLDGLRITATTIQKRRYKVYEPNCPNFEREIASYVWDDKALQNGEERPLKESDHAMDAMRYVCKKIINRARMSD